MTMLFGRVLRTGLSSLRDRAAARLAASRFNPSRWSKRAQYTISASLFFLTAIAFGAGHHMLFAVFYLGLAVFGFWLALEEPPAR
jgi:hypothetical protein